MAALSGGWRIVGRGGRPSVRWLSRVTTALAVLAILMAAVIVTRHDSELAGGVAALPMHGRSDGSDGWTRR